MAGLFSLSSMAWAKADEMRSRNTLVQPTQGPWESKQVCRSAGLDREFADYYTTVSHLSCAGAIRKIAASHFGNSEVLGYYHKCNNSDVPPVAVLTESASCRGNQKLLPLFLRTRDGACRVGYYCEILGGNG